jgi:hypothetical protein
VQVWGGGVGGVHGTGAGGGGGEGGGGQRSGGGCSLGLAKEGGWHIFYNFILFLSVGNVYNRPSVAVVVAVVDGVGVGPKRGFGPLQKVLITSSLDLVAG